MYSCMFVVVFCFFKQKTAYEMRISDWSSTCALPISPSNERSSGSTQAPYPMSRESPPFRYSSLKISRFGRRRRGVGLHPNSSCSTSQARTCLHIPATPPPHKQAPSLARHRPPPHPVGTIPSPRTILRPAATPPILIPD